MLRNNAQGINVITARNGKTAFSGKVRFTDDEGKVIYSNEDIFYFAKCHWQNHKSKEKVDATCKDCKNQSMHFLDQIFNGWICDCGAENKIEEQPESEEEAIKLLDKYGFKLANIPNWLK